MKHTLTALAGAALVVLVTMLAYNATPARSAAPNLVPQARQDGVMQAMGILHKLTDVLIQKMNADIDARNRQSFALEVLGTWSQAQACMLASQAMERRAWDAMACDTLLLALEAQNKENQDG